MTDTESKIRQAAEFSAKEFIHASPAEDWGDSDQEWVRAIYMTAFVKGAIWEKENKISRRGQIQ